MPRNPNNRTRCTSSTAGKKTRQISLYKWWGVPPAPDTQNPRERIQAILAEAGEPLSHRQIRNAARMRAETVGNALRDLVRAGQAVQTPQGYQVGANLELFPAESPRG